MMEVTDGITIMKSFVPIISTEIEGDRNTFLHPLKSVSLLVFLLLLSLTRPLVSDVDEEKLLDPK